MSEEKASLLERLFNRSNKEDELNPLRLDMESRIQESQKNGFFRRRKIREPGAAQNILGVKILEGYRDNPAIFYPDDGDLEDHRDNIKADPTKLRAVAYMDLPIFFSDIMRYMEDATILVRSVPLDLSHIFSEVERYREGKSLTYQRYLEEYKEWIAPRYDLHYDGKTLYARDVLFWGRADAVIPGDSGKSAGSNYVIPRRNQAGNFLFSVIHRLPISLVEDPVPPLIKASPTDLHWNPPGFPNEFVMKNRAFTFWKGTFSMEDLPGILDLEVDILLNIHTITDPEKRNDAGQALRTTYITPILRSSGEIVDGRVPKLEQLDRQLRYLGNWRRLSGEDERVAFRQYVPGSEPLSKYDAGFRWYRRRVDRTISFSRLLVSTVGKAQELTRNNFTVGHRQELGTKKVPVTVDLESRLVATGVVVQTGGGKTTYATGVLGLPHTDNILLVQLHRGKGEAAPLWAKRMGGDVWDWDLPDVVGVSDAQEAQRKELELIRQDQEDAKLLVNDLEALWRDSGLPLGLPLVIRPEAPTTRFFDKLRAFVKAFSEAWEENFVPDEEEHYDEDLQEIVTRDIAKTRQPCILIVDDFSKLPGRAEHATLGKIPANVGMMAHEFMQDAVNSFRKMGMRVIFTTQEEQDFSRYTSGFLGSLTLLVRLRLDEKSGNKLATFVDPQSGRVLYDNVDVTLSPAVLNIVARLEDRRRR